MFRVPAVLAECASGDRGAEGWNWIRQLPEIITAAQHCWSFGLGAVLPPGKELSVLIAVTMPGSQPALAGRGRRRVLLTAAHILQQLWVPPRQEDSFPKAADLARRWHTLIPGRYRALGRPFEPGLVCAAVAASKELARGPRKPVLLHGDFHRGNVLAGVRVGWLAIDPCPVIGDAEFERISPALDSLAATGNGDWDLAFARLLLMNLQTTSYLSPRWTEDAEDHQAAEALFCPASGAGAALFTG